MLIAQGDTKSLPTTAIFLVKKNVFEYCERLSSNTVVHRSQSVGGVVAELFRIDPSKHNVLKFANRHIPSRRSVSLFIESPYFRDPPVWIVLKTGAVGHKRPLVGSSTIGFRKPRYGLLFSTPVMTPNKSDGVYIDNA